jgi:hypoxanthine phosphoribosyltransferase
MLHTVSHPPQARSGAAGQAFELSWELFGELCRALAVRVARDFDPEVVIGIATAGVLPAATIASILQADFYAMKISRRERGAVVRARPEVLSATPVQARGKRVLIVDEITTSGDTLRLALAAVREVGPAEVRTAASFTKPGGYRPDYHALETEALVVFPWDRQIIEGDELVTHPAYLHVLAANDA